MSGVLQVLPYSQIIEIANRHQILTAPFQITCLGQGKQTRPEGRLHTYYLVVEFPQLREFRVEIAERIASRNPQLATQLADSSQYAPHITIGFDTQDLFTFDQGARKDCQPNSYFATVQIVR